MSMPVSMSMSICSNLCRGLYIRKYLSRGNISRCHLKEKILKEEEKQGGKASQKKGKGKKKGDRKRENMK
jgi:hypothetical protein